MKNIRNKICKISSLVLFLVFSLAPTAKAMGPWDILQIGGAFLTHMGIHESGHYVMANMAGAEDATLGFFKKQGGDVFLGIATVKKIDRESLLAYRVGGEAASSYLFDVTLDSYRGAPSTYNRALLLFSGIDFLMYSAWTFYVMDTNNPSYDPIGISQEIGISQNAVLGVAVLQTALNVFRVYSGDDTITPYFGVDKIWAEFGVQMKF